MSLVPVYYLSDMLMGVKVNVHAYSPEILVSSTSYTISPLILEHTFHCWVDRGSMEWQVCPTLPHVTSNIKGTPDLKRLWVQCPVDSYLSHTCETNDCTMYRWLWQETRPCIEGRVVVCPKMNTPLSLVKPWHNTSVKCSCRKKVTSPCIHPWRIVGRIWSSKHKVHRISVLLMNVGLVWFGLCCLMTPGLSNYIRCHVWPYLY